MFSRLASCVLLSHLKTLLVKHWSIARVKKSNHKTLTSVLVSWEHEVAAITRCTVCVTVRDHKNSLMEREPSLAPTWNLTKLYIYIYCRYPYDVYDRQRQSDIPQVNPISSFAINTTTPVNVSSPMYMVPELVMQSAESWPRGQGLNLTLPYLTSNNSKYYVAFYFAEIDPLAQNQTRVFDLVLTRRRPNTTTSTSPLCRWLVGCTRRGRRWVPTSVWTAVETSSWFLMRILNWVPFWMLLSFFTWRHLHPI
jgi:hypothetical protein